MLKRTISLALMLAVTVTAASCIFDPSPPPNDKPVPPSRAFLDRTQMWHVLNNIELAYNKRNINPYDQLLDADFTFFLSTGDVGGGLPDSWGREVEVGANTNLFLKEPPSPLPRCKSIKMDIQWETDPASSKPQPKDLGWVELPGSGPNGDETWFLTTVLYDFQIDVDPDITYISNPGSKAQFTVRQDTDGTWKLVEFRDLGSQL